MRKLFLLLLVIITSCFCCCINSEIHKTFNTQEPSFILQPLNGFDVYLTNSILDSLLNTFEHVEIAKQIQLPSSCFYSPRKRYRADSIIHFLNARATNNQIVIGLIQSDISTTKGKFTDWGVMGLGYCPGKACVISTFRLDKKSLKSQFYKVVIHEIGHTLGLPHCDVKTCFMRDAEGHNPTNEETGFCAKCNSLSKERKFK